MPAAVGQIFLKEGEGKKYLRRKGEEKKIEIGEINKIFWRGVIF